MLIIGSHQLEGHAEGIAVSIFISVNFVNSKLCRVADSDTVNGSITGKGTGETNLYNVGVGITLFAGCQTDCGGESHSTNKCGGNDLFDSFFHAHCYVPLNLIIKLPILFGVWR